MNALSCGLTPDEFWRLTAAELEVVFKAHAMRVESNQWMAAWHAANIMNMWIGRDGHHITAHDLMGKGSIDATSVAGTPEALMAHLEQMEREQLAAMTAEDDDGY